MQYIVLYWTKFQFSSTEIKVEPIPKDHFETVINKILSPSTPAICQGYMGIFAGRAAYPDSPSSL